MFWWNKLTVANQITQIGSCDKSGIPVFDLHNLRKRLSQNMQNFFVDIWVHFYHSCRKLDELTARRQLKSSRSLTCRSIHLTLVTKWSWSWSWMTNCHPLCAMSSGPKKFDHENPWSRSCVRSKVKVTFDLENSKVKIMVKVKHIGHIWCLEFNRYVCFMFSGNRTTFGWDIGNSIFDLENSRTRSWPRLNLMVTFEASNSIDMFAFRFLAIGPFLAEIYQILYLTLKTQGQGHGQGQTRWSHLSPTIKSICLLFLSWQSDQFWLRYSKFQIWPWKIQVKVTTKMDQNLMT